MTAPLLITHDRSLLDELLRLAAAAGVTPDVAADGGAALRGWSAAPLVLVGADAAEEIARLAPARRPRVYVVSWGAVPDELFRVALEMGAESVARLPRSEGWLTELLTDAGEGEPRTEGLLVGVVGGSGGAGATTLACALGQVGARRGQAVVVDADPLGPGVDRVLGLEERDGVRWDGLCDTTGRLSARALREALPRKEGLGALAWGGRPGSLQAFAVREVLSAARRGHDLVVVDLPRTADPLVDEIAARCDRLLVVVVPTVAGVASAVRVCSRHPDPTTIRLVVRGSGIDPQAVARATGVPVLAAMGDQRGLAEAIDLGLGPVRSRRGTLGRAVDEVLDQLVLLRSAAA